MQRLTTAIAVLTLVAAACGGAGQSEPAASSAETGPSVPVVTTRPPAPVIGMGTRPATTEAPPGTEPFREPTTTTTTATPSPATTVLPPAGASLDAPRWEQADLELDTGVAAAFLRRVSGVAADDVLNVRSGPGPGEPIVGGLAPGVTVCITGATAEYGTAAWYAVETPAGTGWVHGGYLAALPGAEPQFDGGVEPVTGVSTGGAFLTDIRMARHYGFDRLVFDLESQDGGVPGFVVSFVEPPFIGVPGNMIPVAGRAFLGILLQGATGWDWEAGEVSYEGPWRIEGDSVNIAEVVITEDFEGAMYFAVGLHDRAPFRASLYRDPLRLVVDVAVTDGAAADPVSTGTVRGEHTGYGWIVDSRLARGDGFDRFVVEFSADYEPPWAGEDPSYRPGIPAWEVGFTAPPFWGCDERASVGGEEFLLVSSQGAVVDAWDGPPYVGERRLTADTGNVVEVVLVDGCDGVQWVLGLDHGAPFTVTTLADPPRLVVDVQH